MSFLLSLDELKTSENFLYFVGTGRNQEKSSIGKQHIIPPEDFMSSSCYNFYCFRE